MSVFVPVQRFIEKSVSFGQSLLGVSEQTKPGGRERGFLPPCSPVTQFPGAWLSESCD